MNLVTPADLSRSYLWHKVYGDQDTLANECAQAATMCIDCAGATPCGGLMPYLGEPLPFGDLRDRGLDRARRPEQLTRSLPARDSRVGQPRRRGAFGEQRA